MDVIRSTYLIDENGVIRYITCTFGELEGGRIVQKAVYAKMERGEMVRYMSGIHAEEPEQIKAFARSGYCFDEARSSDTEYVFVRTGIPGKRGCGAEIP